jgi:hypothetical protein
MLAAGRSVRRFGASRLPCSTRDMPCGRGGEIRTPGFLLPKPNSGDIGCVGLYRFVLERIDLPGVMGVRSGTRTHRPTQPGAPRIDTSVIPKGSGEIAKRPLIRTLMVRIGVGLPAANVATSAMHRASRSRRWLPCGQGRSRGHAQPRSTSGGVRTVLVPARRRSLGHATLRFARLIAVLAPTRVAALCFMLE